MVITVTKRVSVTPAEEDIRDELTRLIKLLVVEGGRVSTAFAASQGLHQTDIETLTHLLVAEERQQQMTIGQLAKDLGLTSGAATFLIDRLSQAGHVTRERHPTDRRKVVLRYSQSGRAVAEEYFGPVGRQSDTTADQFTPAELDVVRRYLTAAGAAMAERRKFLSLPST